MHVHIIIPRIAQLITSRSRRFSATELGNMNLHPVQSVLLSLITSWLNLAELKQNNKRQPRRNRHWEVLLLIWSVIKSSRACKKWDLSLFYKLVISFAKSWFIWRRRKVARVVKYWCNELLFVWLQKSQTFLILLW